MYIEEIDYVINQIINLRDNGYGNIDECVNCVCVNSSDEFINRIWQGLEEEYGIY